MWFLEIQGRLLQDSQHWSADLLRFALRPSVGTWLMRAPKEIGKPISETSSISKPSPSLSAPFRRGSAMVFSGFKVYVSFERRRLMAGNTTQPMFGLLLWVPLRPFASVFFLDSKSRQKQNKGFDPCHMRPCRPYMRSSPLQRGLSQLPHWKPLPRPQC